MFVNVSHPHQKGRISVWFVSAMISRPYKVHAQFPRLRLGGTDFADKPCLPSGQTRTRVYTRGMFRRKHQLTCLATLRVYILGMFWRKHQLTRLAALRLLEGDPCEVKRPALGVTTATVLWSTAARLCIGDTKDLWRGRGDRRALSRCVSAPWRKRRTQSAGLPTALQYFDQGNPPYTAAARVLARSVSLGVLRRRDFMDA